MTGLSLQNHIVVAEWTWVIQKSKYIIFLQLGPWNLGMKQTNEQI